MDPRMLISISEDEISALLLLGKKKKKDSSCNKVAQIKRFLVLLISFTSLLIKTANYQAKTCHLLIKFNTHFLPTDTR